MAKVVLVWNEHPSEGPVTGHHVRAVAKILRSYGHEVIVEKIPTAETIWGALNHGTPAQSVRRLLEIPFTEDVTNKFGIKHGCTVYNFHSSNPNVLGNSKSLESKDFRVEHYDFPDDFIHNPEIDIRLNSPTYAHKCYVVEVPAIKEPIPFQQSVSRNERVTEIFDTIAQTKSLTPLQRATLMARLKSFYQLETAPANLAAQKKYLDPIISMKIADAIHERIK